MHDRIQINAPEGTFAAYVARPQETPAPAIVVIHEVFGVNADMRQTCDDLAARGYLAICPDLFWRLEPGLEMTDQTEAELTKAAALYAAFDLEAGAADIATTIVAARRMPGSNGRVGVVGYCLGGLLTFMTAARVGPDAAVAYYPGNADRHLEEADRVASPLIVHLGEEDEYISKEAQRQIVAALGPRPQATVYRYPGCHHAFARHRGTAYDATAAALANSRTDAFLDQHLKRVGTMNANRPVAASPN
jgi:carboxymethylenebutenolidase